MNKKSTKIAIYLVIALLAIFAAKLAAMGYKVKDISENNIGYVKWMLIAVNEGAAFPLLKTVIDEKRMKNDKYKELAEDASIKDAIDFQKKLNEKSRAEFDKKYGDYAAGFSMELVNKYVVDKIVHVEIRLSNFTNKDLENISGKLQFLTPNKELLAVLPFEMGDKKIPTEKALTFKTAFEPTTSSRLEKFESIDKDQLLIIFNQDLK